MKRLGSFAGIQIERGCVDGRLVSEEFPARERTQLDKSV